MFKAHYLFVLFVLLANSPQADTYKCTDAKGKINFTDSPCPNAKQTRLPPKPVMTFESLPADNSSADNSLERVNSLESDKSLGPSKNTYRSVGGQISIEEAYAAIPHKRTVFNADQSLLPSEQIAALTQLFGLIEQAIVLKIQAGNAQVAKNSVALEQALKNYSEVINAARKLNCPSAIIPAQTLIISAIEKHHSYFQQQDKNTTAGFGPAITSASADLQRAYTIFIQAFPQETPHNKTAFYDYLCALDFL